MKIYNINSRMPYSAVLEEVSRENDKKVRRYRLGHLLFTLQLHSWEIEDFDKKSLDEKEESIKKALPRKVRQSLEKPNHSYDSDTVKQMREASRMIKATTAEIIQREIDAEEAAEKPAAANPASETTQVSPQASADLQTAAAIMSDFKKMIDELMAKTLAAGQKDPQDPANQPAKDPQNPAGDPQKPVKDPKDSQEPDDNNDELIKKYQELDKLDQEIKQAMEDRDKAVDKKAKDAAQCSINNLKKARDKLANEIITMRRPA